MKKANKTLLATLLAGVMAFGVVNIAQAIPPEAQEALAKSQITASQAVNTAQSKIGAEAKVKEVEFRHNKYGKDYFEVDLFGNNQHHKVDVDAASGEILGTDSKTPKEVKVRPEQAAPKISFEQAMKIATDKTGGKVAEADLKFHDGQGFYTIETVTKDQMFFVAVNAENGQIVDMPKHKGEHKHGKGKHDEKHGKGKPHDGEFKGGFQPEAPTSTN